MAGVEIRKNTSGKIAASLSAKGGIYEILRVYPTDVGV